MPRTGGTSIEKQFHYIEAKQRNKHWNLNDWKKVMSTKKFESYFKFSFVRNPWDIVISNYLDEGSYSSSKPGKGGEIGYHCGKSLKYFLDHYQPISHEHGDGLLDYFNPEQMDFVGRFETRAKDLEYISSKIGIKINSNVHKRNSGKKYYTEYYDDVTREIVAERYAQDIEYFGYKFG